jgi:hypothetical protein
MEAMRQSWSDDRLDDLQLEMRAGFARIEQLIERQGAEMNRRFKEVDRRFDKVDRKFEQVDKRADRLEGRLENGLGQVVVNIGRLDGRIDSQARAITYLATVMFTTMAAFLASHFFG